MAREAKAARLNIANSEHNRLVYEIQQKDNMIISKIEIQEKIANLSVNAKDCFDNAAHHSRMITELAKRLKDPNITDKEREFVVNTIQYNSENQIDSIEKGNKVLQKILDTLNSNNSENHFFSQFNDIIESYKDFLSTITLEQHVPLINFLGLIIILFSLISIGGVIFSDYLIKHFNIENKYPKIAKFIQIRRKFQ
jgi:hypothetical protein